MAFPDDRDRRLIQLSDRILNLATDLDDWLAEYNPSRRARLAGEISAEEESELLRLRQTARDLSRSAWVPVAAAVYGPSQVGKSLFVGRVLQPSDRNYSPLGRDEHLGPPSYYQALDFITDLNPQLGEREATALVTRFTTKDRIDPTVAADFPVVVKALTRAEWLRLLARGFKAECRRKNVGQIWDLAALRALFEEARRDSASADPDPKWRTDLYDAYSYMRDHDPREFAASDIEFNGLLSTFRLSAQACQMVAARIFWDEWPEINTLFIEVCELIDKIQETGKGGLLSHWAGVRFLLDSQLSSFHESSTSKCFARVEWADFKLELDKKSGWYVLDYRPGSGGCNMPSHRIQAAMLELVIPVLPERLNEDWRKVIKEIDLLDIPGMRAEKALEQGKRTNAERIEERMEIVKRGKVLYLFERYIEEMQVQTLLLLTRHGNMEVKDQMKYHVNMWGKARFGKAWPRGVDDEPPPLFIGMTGIDAEFRNQKSNPNHLLYDNRINTLIDALGTVLMDNFGGRRFTNIYPVRYPGTWDTTQEERTVREGQEKWDHAGRAFLASEPVQKYVKSPAERWRAAMEDRDGALSLISDGFRVCTSAVGKQDHLKQCLEETGERLLQLAKSWAVDEDANLDRDKRLAVAAKVLGWVREDEDLVYERVLALKEALCFKEADIWGVADFSEMQPDRARVTTTPVTKRFPDHLRSFLNSWATMSGPQRWADFTATCEVGRPWLDNDAFYALATYLVDYLCTTAVFDELVARLLSVITLKLNDEGAARHARWKYVQMVLNDFMTNPGASTACVTELDDDGRDYGLMDQFVKRWAGRLPLCLAEGAGRETVIPPGNAQLHQLIEQYDRKPA